MALYNKIEHECHTNSVDNKNWKLFQENRVLSFLL